MVFISFLISFLFFLYAALAPMFDWVVNGNLNVLAWGLVFFVLGHLLPGAVVAYQTRSVRNN